MVMADRTAPRSSFGAPVERRPFCSTWPAAIKACVLNTFSSTNVGHLGIRTVKPGTYQPACARRAGVDCDPSTRITIPNDGISLFIFEGSATYFWLEGDQARSVLASD